MQLTFLGAVGEVTGSSFLLETSRARVLLDFGMHQGGAVAELRNRQRLPGSLSRLDAVVLSHAHIDHSGLLPLLPGTGSRARVWSTHATADLCGILLPDSAHVQAQDAARWARRHAARRGGPRGGGRPWRPGGRGGDRGGDRGGPRDRDADRDVRRGAGAGGDALPPLYSLPEVEAVLARFATLRYGEQREIAAGVRLRLHDAGHILGSAVVDLAIEDGARTLRLVFSGDVGGTHAPLLRDPVTPDGADVLLMESTYGDRDHRPPQATLDEFAQILQAAHAAGSKVLVPTFAVGRMQQLLYHLGEFRRAGRLPPMPVFVDSPMGISTTELYRRHREVFDAESWALIESGEAPLDFPGLRFCRTPQESMALNGLEGPAVILASSGMLNGGRILHHVRHHGGYPDTHIVIVGFQARGTPGRALVDGARELRLQGESVTIRAQVHTLGGFSAHAGQSELLAWAAPLAGAAPRTFLVHGEDPARAALAARMTQRLALAPALPRVGERVEL